MVAIQTQDSQAKTAYLFHKTLLVLAGLMLVLAGLMFTRVSTQVLPVRQILLEGKFQYISPERLQSALDQYAGAGILTIDLTNLQSRLQKFPWVRLAEVERVWPDIIRVNVIEKTPYLRLGNDQLISVDGTVFSPESTQGFPDLPLMDLDVTLTPELFKAYREMEYLLAQHDYEVKALHVNKQDEWTLELDGNIKIAVGEHHQLVIFKRFIAILPNLGNERIKNIKSIDLRYENGFAIGYGE